MKRAPFKTIQIGFNKCGTRSLHQFMMSNGYWSLHWEQGRLADRMQSNKEVGLKAFDGFDEPDFFCDIMISKDDKIFEGIFEFPYIHESYPDSRFILNIRNVDDWIRSRLRHLDGVFAQRAMRENGFSGLDEVEALWREQWDRHLEAVKAFFSDKPGQLLIFDLDRHGGAEIAAFLPELDLDPSRFGHYGRTDKKPPPSFSSRVWRRLSSP